MKHLFTSEFKERLILDATRLRKQYKTTEKESKPLGFIFDGYYTKNPIKGGNITTPIKIDDKEIKF